MHLILLCVYYIGINTTTILHNSKGLAILQYSNKPKGFCIFHWRHTTCQCYTNTIMDEFVTSIKKEYRDRLINREKQWPPCQSKKLITLELVEKNKTTYPADQQVLNKREKKDVKRTPLAYDDLFKVESGNKSVRRILVTGSAGIGKTTLCTSVSEDWANGKLFQQFELLLFLPLRHKKVSSAGSLCELLKVLHKSKSLCESVVSYLEEKNGEKVLIIADGWDELSESDRQEESFLHDLLMTEFRLASVIITSRPTASAPLHDFMDRFVEVLGFNKDNIEEFIQYVFVDEFEKSDSLLKQLTSNPLLESVCSVPLNCAIVCHLWRALGEALPTTMTELYTKIILNFSLRNIQKLNLYKNLKSLANFNSFPNELQQSWLLLCKFAFETLLNNQIVFSEEELTEFFPNESDKIFTFGLLQRSESILETGCGVSFHFLHLTFQEYLAALHLVKEPYAIDHSFKLEADPSTRRFIFYTISCEFNMMWRFYFGIFFHDSNASLGEQFAIQNLSHIQEISDDYLSILHYAFEAGNKIIAGEAIEFVVSHVDATAGDNIDITFDGLTTAHDISAIIYAIANIQRSGVINIDFSNCSIREKQVTMLADALVSKCGSLQVKKLFLANNNLSDISIIELFEKASAAFQSLEVLNLSHNNIIMLGAISIKQITTTIARSPYNSLSRLDLSHNPLGVPGVQALVEVLRADMLLSLTILNLKRSLTSDEDTNVDLLSALVNALTHCPNFSELNVSHNNFGAHDKLTILYISFVRKNGKLCIADLNLRRNQMKDKNMSNLFQTASSVLQSLVSLNLSDNMIRAESINAITMTVAQSPYNSLSHLDLSYNPLGVPGIQALVEALCADKLVSLTMLNLKASFTSDEDTNVDLLSTLVNALTHCPNFSELNVSHNNFGACDKSTILYISFVRKNGKLCIAVLNLSHNQMKDKHISNLFQRASSVLQSLVCLDLCYNMIGVESINAIVRTLAQSPSNNSLLHLDLSQNPLGAAGLQALEEALCCHLWVNLKHLYLKRSFTGDADINSALLTCFSEDIAINCPNMEYFDVSQNNLGVSGVLAIGKLLSSNFCKMIQLDLSNCQLTTPNASLPQDGADSERIQIRDIEKQLHQMSQNHTITSLCLKENDFSSERIFILSGIMYLCPSLVYLDTSNCRLKSDDLKMLLTQLSNLKISSADVCSRLHTWKLDGNEIDDTGFSVVIDVILSLFPNLDVSSSIPSDIVIRNAMVEERCKQVNLLST